MEHPDGVRVVAPAAPPAAGAAARRGTPAKKKRQSVFLHATWDAEDEFSCFIDYATITESSLRTILLEVYSEAAVKRMRTMKQLVAAARKQKVHEERLRGSDALRYRAGTVVSFLQRLEHVVPDARGALGSVTLVRRAEWAIVSRAAKGSPVKVGSVVEVWLHQHCSKWCTAASCPQDSGAQRLKFRCQPEGKRRC
jgi:hypothetical protein